MRSKRGASKLSESDKPQDVVTAEHLKALEEFEMAQDVAAYDAAKAADAGERFSITEVRQEIAAGE